MTLKEKLDSMEYSERLVEIETCLLMYMTSPENPRELLGGTYGELVAYIMDVLPQGENDEFRCRVVDYDHWNKEWGQCIFSFQINGTIWGTMGFGKEPDLSTMVYYHRPQILSTASLAGTEEWNRSDANLFELEWRLMPWYKNCADMLKKD